MNFSDAARARAEEIDADIRARARAVATGDLKVVGESKSTPPHEGSEWDNPKVVGESKYFEDVDYIQNPQTGLLEGSHGHGGGPSGSARTPAAVEASVKAGVAMGTAVAHQQGVKSLTGSNGHPKIISSAVVTAEKVNKSHPVIVNSEQTFTQPTVEAMKGNSKVEHAVYDRGMQLFARPDFYPNMRPDQVSGTSDDIAKNVIAHMKSNILFLYNKANEKQKEALIWYVGARSRVDGLVSKFGINDASAAGIVAVLSPRNEWNNNVYVAEKLVEIASTKQNHNWDEKMEARRVETLKRPTMAVYKTRLDAIQGKKLGALTDPMDRALWIRMYDEAHSGVQRGGRNIIPYKGNKSVNADGSLDGYALTKKGEQKSANWGKVEGLARAVELFDAKGDRDKISAILRADDSVKHKVRAFYNDILDPFSTNKDVVVDVHAVGAAWLAPLSDNDAPYPHAMATSPKTKPEGWVGAPTSGYTGVQGLYPLYVEAYRQAADAVGVKPDQMQAVVWTVKRDLFSDPKAPLNADAANQIRAMWTAYRNDPAMKLEDVQQQVWDYANGEGRTKL